METTPALKRLAAALLAVLAGASVSAPVWAQASPSAFTSGTRYDAMRRVTGTIAPDPDGAGPLKFAAVRTSFDPAGRPIKVESGELATWQSEAVAPSAWAGFTVLQTLDTVYDSQSRKIKETRSGGGSAQTVTQYSYDLDGRLDCTAVRMNPAAFGSLPASACALGSTGSAGLDRITRNVYDAAGQLLQVREAVGTGIEAAEATYSYTLTGKREQVIDGEGNRAMFVYDGHDRLSQWRFPSTTRPTGFDASTPANALATAGAVNAADFEQYGYDPNGNRTSLRKRDGQTIATTYDALNRAVTKDLPGTAADVAYTYDLRGLQLTAKFSATNQGVTNAYDGFGQLSSTSSNMGGTARVLSYLYDANGNRTRITHPDSNFFTYAYDGRDRLSGILQGAGTSLVTIAYDQLGRRSSLARTGAGSTSYAYDNASRLSSLAHDLNGTTSDHSLTLSYNPASQIISKTASNASYAWTGAVAVNRNYTTNGLNQYTAAGPAAFTYDANGNLTSDGTSTFAYDVENRLTSATAAGATTTLAYDPLGRLAQTVKGIGNNIRLIYDGDDLVAEYSNAGALLRRYVHGNGADEPLVQYEGANLLTKRFLHSDQQGSVIAVTDASGAMTAINRYDEYGIPQSTNAGRFQYTGQQWIGEVGVYYYKARMYSALGGRFLQVDPIGYDDQINLYAYVGNDPVNMTDPTGTEGACFYGPSQCGLRELTPEQQQDREETVSTLATVAITGASLLPAGRLIGWAGRALGIGRAAAPALSQATRTALSGGANATLVRQFSERSATSLNRTIRSLTKRIDEHVEKIRNPAANMTRDDASNPAAVQRAVNDWRKEIRNYSDQRDIARDVLRNRETVCKTGTRIC